MPMQTNLFQQSAVFPDFENHLPAIFRFQLDSIIIPIWCFYHSRLIVGFITDIIIVNCLLDRSFNGFRKSIRTDLPGCGKPISVVVKKHLLGNSVVDDIHLKLSVFPVRFYDFGCRIFLLQKIFHSLREVQPAGNPRNHPPNLPPP